jgi:hypothetical protein
MQEVEYLAGVEDRNSKLEENPECLPGDRNGELEETREKGDSASNCRHSDVSFDRLPVPNVEGRVWSEGIRATAVCLLEKAFHASCTTPEQAHLLASALIANKAEDLAFLPRSELAKGLKLVDLWADACGRVSIDDAEVAGCIVDAFLRSGLPLRPPFSQYIYLSPLALAVGGNAALATALLDLPPHVGLDVSAIQVGRAPPVGHTNETGFVSTELFGRLLRRTDRKVVNAGSIYIDYSIGQYHFDQVHVLVSNILRCTCSMDGPENGMERALLFIAEAKLDGDGTDLTGGVPARAGPNSFDASHPSMDVLWPNSSFRGPLPLINILCGWYQSEIREESSKGWPAGTERAATVSLILARLVRVGLDLCAALRRIRLYRRGLLPRLTKDLGTGNIMPDLCALTIAYTLVPLHDEFQLEHPPQFDYAWPTAC